MPTTGSGAGQTCSFCGKAQHQVIKLIAGPGVHICDQCVDLCVRIIDEEVGTRPAKARDPQVEAAAQAARDAIDRLRTLARRARPAPAQGDPD